MKPNTVDWKSNEPVLQALFTKYSDKSMQLSKMVSELTELREKIEKLLSEKEANESTK